MTNEELVEQIQSGVNITENMYQLYEHNRGIIYKMANRYSWGAPLEDLTQEAYISLCKAVKKYDKQQDIKFISFFQSALPIILKDIYRIVGVLFGSPYINKSRSGNIIRSATHICIDLAVNHPHENLLSAWG